MIAYEEFAARADAVRARIAAACARAGRDPGSVELLAVTKSQPVDAADNAARYGLRAVGENRVQEGLDKRGLCRSAISWELIGHLQSNKARLAAAHFDRIQSVDSVKLVSHLDRAAAEAGRALPVLLQINAGDDPAKHGADVAAAPALLEAALGARNLRVDGLMTIAPAFAGPASGWPPDAARRTFGALRELRDGMAMRFGVPLQVLSMGMTDDMDAAIAAGSTVVRIGTALFGQRK